MSDLVDEIAVGLSLEMNRAKNPKVINAVITNEGRIIQLPPSIQPQHSYIYGNMAQRANAI